MECVEEERHKQLAELKEYIKNSSDELNSILDTLGWSVENLEKEGTDMVLCPLNHEHRMPQKSLACHLETCSLHQEGYKSDEEFLSSSEFLSSPSVVLDKDALEQILQGVSSVEDNKSIVVSGDRQVPRTSARLLTDFTAAERSAIHAHVVSQIRRHAPPSTLTAEDLHLPFLEDDKKSRPKSKLELLAEQRDAKRRRMNHKKVHTSRKTHSEILREVISNQMEFLVSQGSSSMGDGSQAQN